MPAAEFEQLLLDVGGTLRQAIAVIETGNLQIALAVDGEGRLLKFVTPVFFRRRAETIQ
jgi:hypothetical protein